MNVLVVAAHPDDEVLGCGGTIAKLARAGETVDVLILGEGGTSRGTSQQGAVAALREAAQSAGRVLGVRRIIHLGFPDNKLDTVPLLSVIQEIEAVVRALEPDVVFTQAGGDLNIDHSILFRASLTALRPLPDTCVRRVYAYEVASSTEWAFGQFAPRFTPNTWVDIADTLDVKIAAMRCYESEVRPFPHPRSPEALEAQAKHHGASVGLNAAEAFMLVRAVK